MIPGKLLSSFCNSVLNRYLLKLTISKTVFRIRNLYPSKKSHWFS